MNAPVQIDRAAIIIKATLNEHVALPELARIAGLDIEGTLRQIDIANDRGVFFDVISRGPSLRVCRELTPAAIFKRFETA